MVLRYPGLHESLWYDEAYYVSEKLWGPHFADWYLRDVHPPLYPYLMKAWVWMFGDGDVLLRIPSLLAGLVNVVLAAHLARRWFGAEVGVLTGLLLAVSPAHIWYSQENKVNMLCCCLLAASMGAAEAAARRPNERRGWVTLFVFSLLSAWTHTFALPFLCSIYLWLLWLAYRRPPLRKPVLLSALSGLIILGGVLTFILPRLSQGGNLYLRPFTFGELYRLLTIWFANGGGFRPNPTYGSWSILLNYSPGYFAIDLFFLLLLVQGHRSLFRRLQADPLHVAGLVALTLWLTLFGCLLASVFKPHFYIERNVLPLLTPYLVTLSLGLSELRTHFKKPAMVLLTLLYVASLAGMWVFRADQWTVYKPNADLRSVAQVLIQERRAQPPAPFIVFEFTGGPDTLTHYDKGAQIRLVHDLASPSEAARIYYSLPDPALYPQVRGVVEHYGVKNFYFVWERQKPAEEFLSDLAHSDWCSQTGRWDFFLCRLYRFTLATRKAQSVR